MKAKKYELVTSRTADALSEKVTKRLQAMWELHGPTTMVVCEEWHNAGYQQDEKTGEHIVFSQAIIRPRLQGET